MNCEFCQSPVHIWFDCPKKPNGWKPARLANKLESSSTVEHPPVKRTVVGSIPTSPAKSTAPSESKTSRSRSANESLPVDTMEVPAGRQGLNARSKADASASAGSSNGRTAPFDGVNAGSTPAPASKAKFNRAVWYRNYMKLYMRERRAKEREAKNG